MRYALASVVIVMLLMVSVGLWWSEKLGYIDGTLRWRPVVIPGGGVLAVAAVILAFAGGV
jgi:hypothetical protein